MKKKTVNRIVNIVVGVIFILILILVVSIITSRGRGFNSVFGYAMVAVESDSMEGDQDTSFKKGDLIFVKMLKKDEDKAALKKGDVISFYDQYNKVINTHRIVEIMQNNDTVVYQTRGDNPKIPTVDQYSPRPEDVIGVYTGARIGWIGSVFLFFQSKVGFLICVVIPTLLLVLYCIYLVIRSFRARNSEILAGEKERIRAELLAEMREKDGTGDPDGDGKDD